MENLEQVFRGKTVVITGHTGFKGAWLTLMLQLLGARVVGISLAPNTDRDLFVVAGVAEQMHGHYIADIRDYAGVLEILNAHKPQIVFHLAAQPLVRRSYRDPLETMYTNVCGTVNVLEAVRQVGSVAAVIVVTTDKVYQQRESFYGYREVDALGGHDPYSGSKAAADIVAQSYMYSFFNPHAYGTQHTTLLGIVRAGNVIGGGDWSEDRLVPDIMRAIYDGDGVVTVRNPYAVRPWEHVLEPLYGYALLAAELAEGKCALSGAWNFGPLREGCLTTGALVSAIQMLLGRGTMHVETNDQNVMHEAQLLMLDVTKASHLLGWCPMLSMHAVCKQTVTWYESVRSHPSYALRVTHRQIEEYLSMRGAFT